MGSFHSATHAGTGSLDGTTPSNGVQPPHGVTAMTRVDGFGAQRAAAEAALASHGIVLPLGQRGELLQRLGYSDSMLLVVHDDGGAPAAAAGVGVRASRALPGYRVTQVRRLGASGDANADTALLSALAANARGDSRCIRLTVELFDRNGDRRAHMASSLGTLGFARVTRPQSYSRTLALDLAPSSEVLFASLSNKARRDVRAAAKRGLVIRAINDPALAVRLGTLMDETFQRTGSVSPELPWASIIRLSAREPQSSRISGLFDESASGADALVSFAWGAVHGRYATYEAGAMTRRRELGNTPLGYAPLWDLVCWARESGTSWFDFGGVTPGTEGSVDDPVGGISDFKRSFCDNAIDVGEEWVLLPRPLRASIAQAIGSVVRSVVSRTWLHSRSSGVRPTE
jgi:hypothetical protein